MRIGIDGTTLCDKDGNVGAGIEHYTWEIVSALLKLKTDHVFYIWVPSNLSKERMSQLTAGAKSRVKFLKPISPKISFLSRHLFFPLRFALHRVEILFAPNGQLPLGWRGRSVTTLHDVAIYEHPEWFSELGRQDFSVRIVVPRSIAHATKILAVSHATANRLVDLFPEASEKTIVVHEGVQSEFDDEETVGFDKDFTLYLGTVEPRKNLLTAVNAFDAFLQQHPELAETMCFIIAGKIGWGTEEIFARIREVNRYWSEYDANIVRCIGAVTEDEKWNLLHHASVFVYPSLYEGFGLPVLEAMSVGTPVIISREPALMEVGGDAVMVVDHDDVEGMALALAQCVLLPEGISFLRDEGIARAKLFTWERAAIETLRAIETIIE